MKRIFIYIAVFLIGAGFSSCKEKGLDPTSVFVDSDKEKSDFDNWLNREFAIPYNIDVKYRMKDIETPQTNQVVPAKIESSKIMAVLLKHLWIEVYNEATGGVDFMKEYAIRIMHLIGSGAYNANGTVVLGTAEGGKKITLYAINNLDPDDPATVSSSALLDEKGYFQTIHHEFSHIFQQMKSIPETYQQISMEDYLGTAWSNNGNTEQMALDLGFITRYSRSDVDEDFVEIYSMYVTMSAADWNARVARASSEGQDILAEKLGLVKGYIRNSWGMDMDEIRAIILRRAGEVDQLEFVDLK